MAYRRRARTDYIVWHCSATRPNHNVTAAEIDGWHKRQGWPGIAYAKFIRRDGTVEDGADINACAYHAGGHWNNISVGIAYAGGVSQNDYRIPEDNRTPAQTAALIAETRKMLAMFPGAKVIGHNAVAQKACPSFDWIKVCKEYNLPYADLRKPKKSAAAMFFGGVGAAGANEAPDSPTRTGLLDNFDPEVALAPVTNFLSPVISTATTGWFVTAAKIGLGAIAVAGAAFAAYRTYRLIERALSARNAPEPLLETVPDYVPDDVNNQPGT